MAHMDRFLEAAIEEAEAGLTGGGIPIGSVLVHGETIIGRGHNRRVQLGSVVLHGEMDALESAGRRPASGYRECTLYTTLSPCPMCSGAILLYGIPHVVIGENETFLGEEALLREFRKRVGDNAVVRIEYVDRLERGPTGKLRFVVSEIPEGRLDHTAVRSDV